MGSFGGRAELGAPDAVESDSSMAGTSASTPWVVVLGDVMTDILARTHGPIATASDTPTTIGFSPGGSAANVACWLAAAGVAVHFVGCVGADPFGALHRAAFERAGVVPHLAVDPDRPTGTLVALVDPEGERSMLSDRGANLSLTPSALPQALFEPGAVLHLSGYALLAPETRPAALAALALARSRSMRISVDPASGSMLAAAGPADFFAWTAGADLCFPNLEEGRLLTGRADPGEIAQGLCRHYTEVALKLGAEGARWAHANGAAVECAAHLVTEPDTTGAGDAFCAGFLSRWIEGAPADEALAAAVRLGADAASRVGARPPGASFPG